MRGFYAILDATGGTLALQFAVSAAGIGLLVGAAYIAAWYKRQQSAGAQGASSGREGA